MSLRWFAVFLWEMSTQRRVCPFNWGLLVCWKPPCHLTCFSSCRGWTTNSEDSKLEDMKTWRHLKTIWYLRRCLPILGARRLSCPVASKSPLASHWSTSGSIHYMHRPPEWYPTTRSWGCKGSAYISIYLLDATMLIQMTVDCGFLWFIISKMRVFKVGLNSWIKNLLNLFVGMSNCLSVKFSSVQWI